MVSSVIPQPREPHYLRFATLLGCLAVAAVLAVWFLASGSSSGTDRAASQATRAAFTEETGVQIVRVALTGGGGIVDLRYQVVDPDKALIVHENTPVLVHEETNEVIDTFFMGHRHSGRNRPKAGVTYPLLYVNEQGLVEQGSAVSVVIGNSFLQHVTVR